MSRSHLNSRSSTLALLLAITMSATSCQGNSPVSPSGEMESGLPEASGNANGLKLQGSTTIEVIQGKIEMYLPNGDALVRLPDGTLEVLEVTGGRRGAAPIYYGDCPPTLWVVGKCPGGGNAIPSSPSPLVTAKPAPAPSPTSPPKSGIGLPSVVNSPPKAQGKGVFWLNTSSLYLSPNGDGRKESITIDIVATTDIGNWELSVDGYGSTGIRGNGPLLEQPWAGTISGRTKTLPDGKYTLRLTAKGLSRTTEVIIDTTPPDLTVEFDGTPTSGLAGGVIKNVAPAIALKVMDLHSGVQDADGITLEFSKRSDGITPSVEISGKLFEKISETSCVLRYRVPFETDKILYTGDQFLEAEVTDKAGNRRRKRISFAIGDHDLFSGIPDPGNAYKLNFIDESVTYRVPEKFNNPKYTIRKVPYQAFMKKVPGNAPGPNFFMYMVRASAVTAPITFVFFDQEVSDLAEFITRGTNIIHTDFGDIRIDPGRIKHAKSGHSEIDPTNDGTLVHTILSAIAESSRHRGKFELWRNSNPKGTNRQEIMLAYKDGAKIYRLIVTESTIPKLGPGLYFTTGFGSGVYKGQWPDLVKQWSGVVTNIAQFKKKDNLFRKWDVGANGRFLKHEIGSIDDLEKLKNYNIIHEVKAVPRQDRRIVQVEE